MPLYFITKQITTYLTVNCNNVYEAHAWGKRIVAGLEDENGKPVPPRAVEEFVAEFYPAEMTVELLEEQSGLAK